LVRGDLIAAFSRGNIVYLLELKKIIGTNNQGTTAVLVPLAKLKFIDVEKIYGVCWALESSHTSFDIIVSGQSLIYGLDLNATDFTQLAYVEGSSTSTTDTTSKPRQFMLERTTMIDNDIIDMRSKVIFHSFHCCAVTSMSLSKKTCTVATLSVEDDSIRIRDYSKFNGIETVKESFRDRCDEMPLCMDLHPNGNLLVTGTDQYMIEYCVSDTKLEQIKKYDMRIPFSGPTGVPFVNTSPISLVKYSNNGNL
jgi:hypothetical protein